MTLTFEDAKAICRSLILDLPRLKDAKPDDLYYAMKKLLAIHDHLVEEAARVTNALHAHLMQHYPNYQRFFRRLDGRVALAFFERFPSPRALLSETEESLADFLREKRYPGRYLEKARQILSAARESGWTTSPLQDAHDEVTRSCVRRLMHLKEEIRRVKAALERLVYASPYPNLLTMPGISIVTAAAIIAYIGDVSRFRSADQVAKYAGICPVSFSSGERISHRRNRYGKRRLNHAFYMLAVQHVATDRDGNPRNPLMYAYYQKKLAEKEPEHRHRAMVYVMRRLVNIVFRMMKTGSPYREPATENGSS
ncbi:MAG: IS110 family transposase [Thermanaeromonas sp.]|uniref:IS110 family transposase n=1 Tax=Thermanaeromonas sp. TaxID=2003697 RepID=UPI00243FD1FF|nr:IS110 family transposase [Thermanaeromonas sp.]MCG0277748.1 IS110 family transposase [Thermanaeromonas sp.]